MNDLESPAWKVAKLCDIKALPRFTYCTASVGASAFISSAKSRNKYHKEV